MAIKLVVDSTSDLPDDIVEKYDIRVVPLTVNFENESFLDKVELTTSQFLEKLKKAEKLPTTSQVSPGEFVNVFKEILDEGNEILGIFIANELSGTTESAFMAKEIIGSDKIHIIDSRTVTLGAASLILEAARLIEKNYIIEEIEKQILEYTKKVKFAAIVDTLKYLEKGGRLSKKQAIIGSILNVKPIINVENGVINAIDKVRGKAKGIKWITNWVEENKFDFKDKIVFLYYSDEIELLNKIKDTLLSNHEIKEIVIGEIGAVVSTHAGPGCVGIAFIDK